VHSNGHGGDLLVMARPMPPSFPSIATFLQDSSSVEAKFVAAWRADDSDLLFTFVTMTFQEVVFVSSKFSGQFV
jgi:hypothetical protein